MSEPTELEAARARATVAEAEVARLRAALTAVGDAVEGYRSLVAADVSAAAVVPEQQARALRPPGGCDVRPCPAQPTSACGCTVCVARPERWRFFACDAHRGAVAAMHRGALGREAFWVSPGSVGAAPGARAATAPTIGGLFAELGALAFAAVDRQHAPCSPAGRAEQRDVIADALERAGVALARAGIE